MKKLLIITAIFINLLVGISLTSFWVQGECFRLNSVWVDSGCTAMYPCPSVVESGEYTCCIFALPDELGKDTCNENDNYDYQYVLRRDPVCGKIPCQYVGGNNTYCIGGVYIKPAGFTDWVAADSLSGSYCVGGPIITGDED
ncbi:MAG: hypothetical protein HPY51_04010 [Candidatus Omnitrophica bacterium]|nr:hypothetical protein [Candidatus Omnitrophota bacterium]